MRLLRQSKQDVLADYLVSSADAQRQLQSNKFFPELLKLNQNLAPQKLEYIHKEYRKFIENVAFSFLPKCPLVYSFSDCGF